MSKCEKINVLDLSSNELLEYMTNINPCLAGTIIASTLNYCYELETVFQPRDDIPNTLLDDVYAIFSSYFYRGDDVDKENFYYKCDEDKFRSGIHYIIWYAFAHFFVHHTDNEIMNNMEIIHFLNDAILICESIDKTWEFNNMLICLIAEIKEYRKNNKDDNIVYVKLIHDGEIQKTIL